MLGVVRGADRGRQNLLRFWGPARRWSRCRSAASPRCSASAARELAGVLVFTMRGELIQAIHVIADPRKLDFLRSQLTAPASGNDYGAGCQASPTSLSAGTSRPYWCRHDSGGPAKEQPDERTI